MILIGSRALVLRAPGLLDRKPLDYDFIASKEEAESFIEKNSDKIKINERLDFEKKIIVKGDSIIEFELIKPDSSNEMAQDLINNDKETVNLQFGGMPMQVPSLDMLYTIKSSHKYLKNSDHFWKNAMDYHRMKAVGAKIRPEFKDFHSLREKETYTYKHPKLNQSKSSFFADGSLLYKYDHDSIHVAVKNLDKPAYRYYMKDGEEVQCDRAKFDALPENIKMLGVQEESAVLAIERSLVPHPGVWSPKQAWHFALSKVCTSITSGWFRAFAYENLFKILKIYPENYFEKFQSALADGIVKAFSDDSIISYKVEN